MILPLLGERAGARADQPLQQNNGRFGRAEQAFFQGRNFAFSFYALQRWKHERKRFLLAVLSFAQKLNCVVVPRIHHQVKSTQPLDRDGSSFTNRIGGGEQDAVIARWRKGGTGFQPVTDRQDACPTFPQFQPRAANRARVRLGMEAAVVWFVVFGPALWTHRERLHRGVRAVVGQRFDDAEARTAIGAVGERITVAAVLGIEDFAQAIRARGDVRQHQRGLVAADFAGADFKCRAANGVKPRSFEALDETSRRFFGFEPEQEFFQFRTRAFDFNEDPLRGIVDPAGQSEFRGEAEDKRTEADALHRTANGEFQARALAGCSGFVHVGILSEPPPN